MAAWLGQGRGVDAEGIGAAACADPEPQSSSKPKRELHSEFRQTVNDESSGCEYGGSSGWSRRQLQVSMAAARRV
jgi:hypothetical protein